MNWLLSHRLFQSKFQSKLQSNRPFPRLMRLVLMGILAFGLVLSWTILGWVAPALSQLPSAPTNVNNAFQPPSQVMRYGEYETAQVRSPVDNKLLFEVTSPTIFNRNDIPEGQLPVEIRAKEVSERLWRVFRRTLSAQQTPIVTIVTLNNRPVIQVSDDQSTRPLRLITVTDPDSDFNGEDPQKLGQEWQAILQEEVARFKEFTAPQFLFQRLTQAFQVFLGLLIASAAIWFLRRILTRRQQTLETLYQQQLATIVEAEKVQNTEQLAGSELDRVKGEETEVREIADLRAQFLTTLQYQFSVKRRLDFDKFLKWALLWIFVGMWYLGIFQIMYTVPFLMRWSYLIWATPLALLGIWFGISLAIRVSTSLIERLTHSWNTNSLLPLGEAQRVALRTKTISEALKGLITFALTTIGLVWTLGLFGIPTSSILAGGAVIGLAISFGSQSLVKDLVNGCLILIEDQFAVGDVIQVDNKSGLVENLNLRVTQLRNSAGQLITIPNSNITNVSNLTRLWSRIDFSIVVAYENDPKQVLEVLRQVSQQLYSEPEWRAHLPEPPDVLGIDDLSHTGMLVRVWIKTAPMQQWRVGREFRLRVRQAFEINHIQIGKPQLINYNLDLSSSTLQN